MEDSVLIPSLKGTQLEIIEQLVAEQLDAIDPAKAIIYIIDRVDAAALPSLARQFNVDGFKGWDLCQTEQDRRDLIKRAIELHKTKGTPFAIKQALRSIGFYDAEIIEGLETYYNGAFTYDGTVFYDGGGWAYFSVIITVGDKDVVNLSSVNLIRRMIAEYKSARSVLVKVSYRVAADENLIPIDDADMAVSITVGDELTFNAYYDGSYNYNGTIYYSGDLDEATLKTSSS